MTYQMKWAPTSKCPIGGEGFDSVNRPDFLWLPAIPKEEPRTQVLAGPNQCIKKYFCSQIIG